MSDTPSWKDLIDMVSNIIQNVDDNAKRENDKLHDDISALRCDITTLRQEMNDSREDTFLNRTEMANLRTDMAELKSELKLADCVQIQQLEVMKVESGIFQSTKAKLAAIIISILTVVSTILLKILEFI